MNTDIKQRPISQILAAEAYERNKAKKKIRAKDFDQIEDKEERRKAYLREYSRKWREQHPDYYDRYRKGVRRDTGHYTTTDRQREQMKQWREKHPDYMRNYFKRRREEARAKMKMKKENRQEKLEGIRRALPKNVRDILASMQKSKPRN